MATLVLTAVGTALGGPLGGAIGSLAGRALDTAVFGSSKIEGGRLQELAVTTSSYGSYLPRHFGAVRAAGSIIWATDLIEHKETSGGGKGKPKVSSFTYSISCAVALASRPIKDVARIWADGNLLRSANGVMKVGGTLRIHTGEEDQAPDPLILSDMGDGCPAFRGLSYIVFEDLQLADFGNRIPALTFEIIADDGTFSLTQMLTSTTFESEQIPVEDLAGLTHDAGSDGDLVAMLNTFYPIACRNSNGRLALINSAPSSESVVMDLPPPVASADGEFASRTGTRISRKVVRDTDAISLRYYDTARDYQPGLQRSRGKSGLVSVETIEFPASISADKARSLADRVASNRESGREIMSYRVATIDQGIACGSLVRPSGERGIWQVRTWEWRSEGVELELEALPAARSQGLIASGDAGQIAPVNDRITGPTVLTAFELPWDGTGSGTERQVMAAVSSPEDGWSGAALYVDSGDGALTSAGFADRQRATIGTAQNALPSMTPHLFDRTSSLIVTLLGPSFALPDADIEALARGANSARIGEEIVQFANAEPMGNGQWRLSGFLRGRGGTEQSIASHVPGETFVLLDERLTTLDMTATTGMQALTVSAIGNGDPGPVSVPLSAPGFHLRPLVPVKGSISDLSSGEKKLTWTRRARGAWQWLDEVDVPISEPAEAYDVRFMDGNGAILTWETANPSLIIAADLWEEISSAAGPRRFEIRQIGRSSLSHPLTLTI